MFEVMPLMFNVCKQGIKISTVTNGLLRNITSPSLFFTPTRTTMVLKRRFPVRIYREGNNPRKSKGNYLYDLVEDTDIRPDQMMDIVLKSYVSGVGNPGDVITLKRGQAYNNFILPGLADYPTPENLEYSRQLKGDKDVQEKLMSPSVEYCINYLTYKGKRISIVMNKETEWTIEPWHVRASFRKAGIHILSKDAIELPSQPIRGPDMNIEGKEFDVIVTINKTHKAKVSCRIHHWSTALEDRLPWEQEFWLKPREMVFPEDNAGKEAISDSSTPKTT